MRKKIIVPAMGIVFFTAISCLSTHAQALSSADIKAQMVKDWERAKSYTDEYLAAMPADKYSFKATDSVRSFAQQMLHLSQGNVFLMPAGSGQTLPAFAQADLEHRASAQTRDSVAYFVNASYDYCITAVKTIDPGKWGEKKKMGNMEESTLALMMKAFEHQTHHRGQTTVYIRLAGIKPPQERLF